MNKLKSLVKEGGLLFLAVPVGQDHLQWNTHRIYGRIRLPSLFEGWHAVDAFGFTKEVCALPLVDAPAR